jgi:hypothetical protein
MKDQWEEVRLFRRVNRSLWGEEKTDLPLLSNHASGLGSGMKTKLFIWPTLWVASAFCVAAQSADQAQNKSEKKPPQADAQSILDSLNSERTPMHTADGQLDPEEVAHVQRMIRLYELKAGFTDPQSARGKNEDTASARSDAVAQREDQSQVEDLQSEVVDLRQQLQNLQQQNAGQQNNGAPINEAAGAQRARERERERERTSCRMFHNYRDPWWW